MDQLNADPNSTTDGIDHTPRQVYSGHYVPVRPTPIKDPEYISHSKNFFAELGLNDDSPKNEIFFEKSFRETFRKPNFLFVKRAVPRAMLSQFMELNTPPNALFVREMATVMDAPSLFLKVFFKEKMGNATKRRSLRLHTAEALMEELSFVQVFESFRPRNTCMLLEYQRSLTLYVSHRKSSKTLV